MSRLATPVFNGAPTDVAAMVDVYNAVDPEVRNTLTSKLTAFGTGLDDVLGGTMNAVTKVGKKLTNNGMDLASAKERIQRALGGSRSDILSLATSVQDSIFSELTGVDSGTNHVRKVSDMFDSLKVITTKGERLITDGDYKSANALMGFISDITRNPVFKMFDLGAETALLTGVMGEISKWGIPDLIDDVLAELDEPTRWSVVSRSSKEMMNTADVDVLEGIVDRMGGAVLTVNEPEFPVNFISRYAIKAGVTPEHYPARLAQLFKVMDALLPNWFYTNRGSEQVLNFTVLCYASEGARTLLASDDRYRAAAVIAPAFRTSRSAQAMLKTNYPGIAIR